MATVLVVDDHVQVNTSISRVIRAEGYATLSVFSGADALALLSATPPDLVILDVNLPDMSGISVLKAIRADPKTSTLPVVMFSAVSDPVVRRHALWLGANDYWVKAETNPALIGGMIANLLRPPRLSSS